MTRTMYRIYFDSNNGVDGGYSLSCFGSLQDIAPIEAKLREGMHVTLYMTGEMELEAVLEFDRARGRWIGRPVAGTLRYLDGTQPQTDPDTPR